MLFTSFTFLYFQVLVVALRWSLPRRVVGPMLLVAGYTFYLSAGPIYALLISSVTIATWFAALHIERTRSKWMLGVSIAGLLLILGYFKYANFVLEQAFGIYRLLGGRPRSVHYSIVLPLAISFFTFELISYLIDVYRGEQAERSLWRFSLYIVYYPHLIAGPIVRAHELLPSLRSFKSFDGRQFSDGMFIALAGYFKKTVLADNLAPWADAVFSHPAAHSTFGTWMGVIAYTGQIYCDFSGYTDIARGCSLMLGLPLPDNFEYPYLSRSITDFWRRWHMTLSRWLRDYLYISLGGNRRGVLRQYRNLFLTMLLGGLWHGANWTFVAWGAWHGVLLCVHKVWSDKVVGTGPLVRARETLPYKVLAGSLTLLCVMAGWVLFRARTFQAASVVFGRLVRDVPGAGVMTGELPQPLSTAISCTVVLVIVHIFGYSHAGFDANRAMPAPVRGVFWAVIAIACFLLAESRATFIYFQF